MRNIIILTGLLLLPFNVSADRAYSSCEIIPNKGEMPKAIAYSEICLIQGRELPSKRYFGSNVNLKGLFHRNIYHPTDDGEIIFTGVVFNHTSSDKVTIEQLNNKDYVVVSLELVKAYEYDVALFHELVDCVNEKQCLIDMMQDMRMMARLFDDYYSIVIEKLKLDVKYSVNYVWSRANEVNIALDFITGESFRFAGSIENGECKLTGVGLVQY